MANNTIGDYTAAITIDGSTHYLLIQPGSASTAYKKINRNVFLGVTGQPADTSSVQNFTNKVLDNTSTITVKDSLFTLQDNLDTSKQAQFQLSGITTATTRTYTLPNASSTLADTSTAQTFTNKTLTSPVITGGTITNSTIAVDAIAEFTVANGVTIDGLNIKDGALNTSNSVITASITDGAVTPAKLQSGTGSGWSWQTYTPSFTNVTVGNGTLTARYIQTGKTVFVRVDLVFGNTTSTSGEIIFTLPVTSVAYGVVNLFSLGMFQAFDTSASGLFSGNVNWTTTTSATARFMLASGTYVTPFANTGTAPATWATGDEFSMQFAYEAA